MLLAWLIFFEGADIVSCCCVPFQSILIFVLLFFICVHLVLVLVLFFILLVFASSFQRVSDWFLQLYRRVHSLFEAIHAVRSIRHVGILRA